MISLFIIKINYMSIVIAEGPHLVQGFRAEEGILLILGSFTVRWEGQGRNVSRKDLLTGITQKMIPRELKIPMYSGARVLIKFLYL